MILKTRVPDSWIQTNGKIKLPLLLDRVLQFDPELSLGAQQDDAMQELLPKNENYSGGFRSITSFGCDASDMVKIIRRGETIYYCEANSSGSKLFGDCDHTFTIPVNRKVRTAIKNRERTINGLLCIVTGRVLSTKVSKHWLWNAQTLQQFENFPSLNFAIGKNGIAVGFNKNMMLNEEYQRLNQSTLAEKYKKATDSDPLGIFSTERYKTLGTKFLLENFFDKKDRHFRADQQDFFFSSNSDNNIRICAKNDKTDKSLEIDLNTSNPNWFAKKSSKNLDSSYNKKNATASSVIIHTSATNNFKISNFTSGITLSLAVKEDILVMEIRNGSTLLINTFYESLKTIVTSDTDKKGKLEEFLKVIPKNGLINIHHNDSLTNAQYRNGRFYFKSDRIPKFEHTQKALAIAFKSAGSNDNTGFYSAYSLQEEGSFNAEKLLPNNKANFYVDGCHMRLGFDKKSIQFKSLVENGPTLKIEKTLSIKNQSDF